MEISGYVYKASAGESFDSIALAVYGDEKYAAELLCANPEICGNLQFAGGEVLRLPVVAIQKENNSGQTITAAPWKE